MINAPKDTYLNYNYNKLWLSNILKIKDTVEINILKILSEKKVIDGDEIYLYKKVIILRPT